MCRNVEVAEWSREVSSGEERINLGEHRKGIEREKATFNGNKLDHDDTKPEAFVRSGLKGQFPRNNAAGDVKRVGEGDGHLDLGMMRRSVHGLWPGLGLKRHSPSGVEESKGRWTRT